MRSDSFSTRIRAGVGAILLAIGLVGPARAFTPNGVIVFMTDFGLKDDAVAICKGVMLSTETDLEIIDLTHDVTPFAIDEGALYLAAAAAAFPPGTVFVAVVDPGVGTARRAVVMETANGRVFVAPDNGLLTAVIDEWPDARAWGIENPDFVRADRSPTFHGRDVFAPSAAVLASGRAGPADAGAPLPIADLVRIAFPRARETERGIEGRVLLLDKAFGNVWTNIPRELLEADGKLPPTLELHLGGDSAIELPLVATFGEVAEGHPLAYVNSRGRLSFAVNLGNFSARFGVVAGDPVLVTIVPARSSPPAGPRP